MWRISCALCTRSGSLLTRYRQVATIGALHSYANGPNKWDDVDADVNKLDKSKLYKLIPPVQMKADSDSSIVAELTGRIDKSALLRVLEAFSENQNVREMCTDNGFDDYIQEKAFASFRRYCFETSKLPDEIYIKLYDIVNGQLHLLDLFPIFGKFIHDMFPHLNCMDELRKVSDLSNPAEWYPHARSQKRRIIFHGGPTNSGKTYQAMQRFLNADSGIYCGPLKLLAMEVFQKSNDHGTVCDLVTGEERRYGRDKDSPAEHVAITVEMAPIDRKFDVAVIDEIQQIGDPSRGWAWTRAFLGIHADEVHVCGEPGTLDLLQRLCLTTGETVELNTYKRLTTLTVEDKALESFSNLQPGDCIVCFNKNDIYAVAAQIESMGKEVAVIYGGLPPNTKLMQAARFNDPKNPCKIMVATDAIGMGLNLNIRRVIFYSMCKVQLNIDMEKEIKLMSVSSALQIAGRAGRFGSQWENGFVTTHKSVDLPTLKFLLGEKPEPIEHAGLQLTSDQIEIYAFHLPNAPISNLIEIFNSLSVVKDDLYFMCLTQDFTELSKMIDHITLPLRARYVFCCAPVNRTQPFICTVFTKFVTHYSKLQPITYEMVSKYCLLPAVEPKTIAQLAQLENIFDIMDIYLWLSYRFPDIFMDGEKIRAAQKHIDDQIQKSVREIIKLAHEDESRSPINAESHVIDVASVISSSASPKKVTPFMKESKFSEYLINKGVVSPKMIQKLHQEFQNTRNANKNSRSTQPPRKRK